MKGGKILNITNRKTPDVHVTTILHAVIKGATTQTFLFLNVEVSKILQKIFFKKQNISAKPFAYAKFVYRTVSNFNISIISSLKSFLRICY